MQRHYSLLDRCLLQFDQAVRTLFAPAIAERKNPAATADISADNALSADERRQSIGLLRVNHSGEVSAQALYHAQALTARSAAVRTSMQQAATEENDHLAWCEQRLQNLGAHTSYLNPLWYAGSFAIGICAGLAGDAYNLGFLAETERQVVNHLDKHLQRLPANDVKSRLVLTQMREDEAHHATVAWTAGAVELPMPVKILMQGFANIMTRTAYWF